MTKMEINGKKVFVAGHKGMVGSAILRKLEGYDCEVLTASKQELDLRDQSQVRDWVCDQKPDLVFLAAAKVGGIHANDTYPGEFLYDNLMIQSNLIHAAKECNVKKLLFLGSSCIYPKFAEQPIPEEALLTGSLEPTNQWYAIAKIAGLKMCQAYRREYGCNFISAMPSNLYGIGDNFDLENSHVIPALIRKFHEAKEENHGEVVVWGSGKPLREFLYVDDLAEALIFLMENYSEEETINVGSGEDLTITDLATKVAVSVGFHNHIRFDPTKPDGTPRKLLDISRIKELGWESRTSIEEGLNITYQWFCQQLQESTS